MYEILHILYLIKYQYNVTTLYGTERLKNFQKFPSWVLKIK